MELFKYCKSEHMNAMLERGCARIGTLFDWRRDDRYGELVADPNEGHTNLSGNLIFYDVRHISAMIVDSTVKENGELPGAKNFINSAVRSADHFAFSAAMTYSPEDHMNWYEREQYDACYRIHSSKLFLRSLSRSIEVRSRANFVCAAPVLYVDESATNNVFSGTFHPALLKRSAFGSQGEFRALWTPIGQGDPMGPISIDTSEAKKYVSQHVVLLASG